MGKVSFLFPGNLFVAEFMGNPSTNLLQAELVSPGPPAVIALDGYPDHPLSLDLRDELPAGDKVILNVRPEDVGFSIERVDSGIPAIVYASLPTGSEYVTYAHLEPGGEEIVMKGPEEEHVYLKQDQRFLVTFKRGNVFHPESKELITSFGFKEK